MQFLPIPHFYSLWEKHFFSPSTISILQYHPFHVLFLWCLSPSCTHFIVLFLFSFGFPHWSDFAVWSPRRVLFSIFPIYSDMVEEEFFWLIKGNDKAREGDYYLRVKERKYTSILKRVAFLIRRLIRLGSSPHASGYVYEMFGYYSSEVISPTKSTQIAS